MMGSMLKRTAALFIAIAVLGAGAYAWAQEAPDQSSTPGQETEAKEHKADGHRLRGRFFRRAVHGELIIRAGEDEFKTVQIDRGQLVAASETSVTVKRADGEEVTKTVNEGTRVRGAEAVADLEKGKPTLIVSEGESALVVGQRRPAEKKAEAGAEKGGEGGGDDSPETPKGD